MRHTLLPHNERKNLRRDYSIRLAIIFGLLISFSGVVGVGALFPAYIHEIGEEKTAIEAAAQLKKSKDQSGQTAIESELRANTVLMNRLNLNKGVIRPSSTINTLISLREKIILTSFVIDKFSTSTVSLVLQGTAPTREELIDFKSRIERTLPKSTVQLPVSELAKTKNVQFSMKISYSTI